MMLPINAISKTSISDIGSKSSIVRQDSSQGTPTGVKVSLTSWLNDDVSETYPDKVKQYLASVQNDPNVTEKEKNRLFFNLVLRPKSEARLGGELAQAVISSQDKTAWKQYLSSLQYLSMLNAKSDSKNSSLHNNLTNHYQNLAAKL
ncbi:hypothetical protein [Rheinheimera fenheensis]|uniref:hypothetical protein n=1 Tax=Rheinheimera fenheensis TaxID=3152295 RepID=UPI0032614B5B